MRQASFSSASAPVRQSCASSLLFAAGVPADWPARFAQLVESAAAARDLKHDDHQRDDDADPAAAADRQPALPHAAASASEVLDLGGVELDVVSEVGHPGASYPGSSRFMLSSMTTS